MEGVDLTLNSAAGPGLVAGAVALALALLFLVGLRFFVREARASGRVLDWLGAGFMLVCFLLAAAVVSTAALSAIMAPSWL